MVALTFSSGIVIVKFLSDKRELDTLHGRIAVGFLIVQDIAVVLAMMAMSALRATGEAEPAWLGTAASIGVRVVAAAVALYLLLRYLLLPLIFAIAWGTALAALGECGGFSRKAGAFLAGFSLASIPYRDAMSARLTGIRDFLLLFFFIDLGAKLNFSTLGGELWPAAILALLVLIGNRSSSWPSWAIWATASAPASWPGSPRPRSASSPSSDELQRLFGEEGEALAQLAADIDEPHGVSAGCHLVERAVLDAIVAQADFLEINLLIVGARDAGFMRHWLLGHTAERLLRKTLRPVLVVKHPPREA